jgi:hypothetical protein
LVRLIARGKEEEEQCAWMSMGVWVYEMLSTLEELGWIR